MYQSHGWEKHLNVKSVFIDVNCKFKESRENTYSKETFSNVLGSVGPKEIVLAISRKYRVDFEVCDFVYLIGNEFKEHIVKGLQKLWRIC